MKQKISQIKSIIYILVLILPLVAQETEFVEEFTDEILTGWAAEEGHDRTFELTEKNGWLLINYHRTSNSKKWDNFNFSPPYEIDVSHFPKISLQIKSSVATKLSIKPIYGNEEDGPHDWLQQNLPGDNQWHDYTFDLKKEYYEDKNLNRIYFYLDGGATAVNSGEVSFDNVKIGGYHYHMSALDTNNTEHEPSAEAFVRTYSHGLAPSVSVSEVNSETVGLYEKFEITAELTNADFDNPYNPEEIDLRGLFISPEKDTLTIFGFYNDYNTANQWLIRFSPDVTGEWHYYLEATDKDGKGISNLHNFTATESNHHGWLQLSKKNPYYLEYADGTDFYGIAVYYPWAVTESGLDRLKNNGVNFFGYWNGNYDWTGNGGGRYQIESARTGIGVYDQQKCARVDEIIEWAEARDMIMDFAIWPHDVLDETVWGYNGWAKNAFKEVCPSADFFFDPTAWEYQKKLYRYIIARWGYSRSMGIWEFVNEINGTDPWVYGDETKTLLWVQAVQNYFKENDPWQKPTTIAKSGGHYWEDGYEIVDMPDVHLYETVWNAEFPGDPVRSSYWTYRNVTRRFRQDFAKPAIMGEAGAEDSYGGYTIGSIEYTRSFHNALWSSWANGLSMTPVWWEYSLMSNADLAQMKAHSQVTTPLPYRDNLIDHCQLEVKECDAFGMYGDSLGFGWIHQTGESEEEFLYVLKNLNNGSYTINWYNTWTGNIIGSYTNFSAFEKMCGTVPFDKTNKNDIAYTINQIANGEEPNQILIYFIEDKVLPVKDSVYTLIGALSDAEGRLVEEDGREIHLSLTGPGTLSAETLSTKKGLFEARYTSSGAISDIQIIATSEGIVGDTIALSYQNQTMIDDFENFSSNEDLKDYWSTVIYNNGIAEISLNTGNQLIGNNSICFDYELPSAGAVSVIKREINGAFYEDVNYLSLHLLPDGSGRDLIIGFIESPNFYWQTTYTMDTDKPVHLQIPLKDLTCSKDSNLDFSQVNTFFLQTSLGEGESGAGTLYADNISMLLQKIVAVEEKNKNSVPEGFVLGYNYPNPFNPATTITFQIPQAANVLLQIYDLRGNLVKTLINEPRQPGRYKIQWHAKNQPSGVYLYKLISDNYTDIKKCILLK